MFGLALLLLSGQVQEQFEIFQYRSTLKIICYIYWCNKCMILTQIKMRFDIMTSNSMLTQIRSDSRFANDPPSESGFDCQQPA